MIFTISLHPTSHLFRLKSQTPNITLFKCGNHFNFSTDIYPGFGVFSHCNDHSILFYGYSKQSLPHAPSPAHALVQDNCSVFHFPVQPPLDGDWSASRLLPLLKMGFSLEWKYPPECHDCETKCQKDRRGALEKCAGTKQGILRKLTFCDSLFLSSSFFPSINKYLDCYLFILRLYHLILILWRPVLIQHCSVMVECLRSSRE